MVTRRAQGNLILKFHALPTTRSSAASDNTLAVENRASSSLHGANGCIIAPLPFEPFSRKSYKMVNTVIPYLWGCSPSNRGSWSVQVPKLQTLNVWDDKAAAHPAQLAIRYFSAFRRVPSGRVEMTPPTS